jgi:hypothetical protein
MKNIEDKNILTNEDEYRLIIDVFKKFLNSVKDNNSPFCKKLVVNEYEIEEKEHVRFFNVKVGYIWGRWTTESKEKINKIIEDVYKFTKIIEYLPNSTGKKNYIMFDFQSIRY